ncbi:MAG TPA: STT3 domain-containing protein [Nitrososphaeraceae archaeon]
MFDSSTILLRVGSLEFRSRHLLIIAVLAIAFTTAFIMRSFPAKYGFYLHEYDPYFNYRATKYILDNGLDAYWNWNDNMSWYPEGRDVPKTSQSGLHLVTAFLYSIFGGGLTLLDFTIILPVVLGSLTTIIVFALVRIIGGTTAGMFSALLIAFNPAIIQRGNLGWFKSEPLGLFSGLLAIYLFLSAIKDDKVKYAIPKAAAGGLLLGIANASWGGIQYLTIPIALFLIALPFFKRDTKIPMYVAIVFTLFTITSVAAFPRPGISFVFGFPGIALMGATVFLVNSHFLKKLSSQRKEVRNTLFLLIAFFMIALIIVGNGLLYSNPRYMKAINPFLSSQSETKSGKALLASISEHSVPTLIDYFTNYSILLMFAGFGVWFAFKRRDLPSIFVLIIGLSAVYVSGAFVRLLPYASIGIIMLAGIGLGEVMHSILRRREPGPTKVVTKKLDVFTNNKNNSKIIKVVSVMIIIFIISLPVVYPRNLNWLTSADIPPPIVSDGRGIPSQTNDWINALGWISNNTPKNSVIASWWDYGYWIETLGNRTTLADNANYRIIRTVTMAKMLIDQEETGIKMAQMLGADYILTYVEAERFIAANGTTYYTFGYGGDESKMLGIMRIGGFDESKYLEGDRFTTAPIFWNTTLLGKLIPLNPAGYAIFKNGEPVKFLEKYKPGSLALYSKQMKYPNIGLTKNQNSLNLVYSSDSFKNDDEKLITAVLIYKINHDYYSK